MNVPNAKSIVSYAESRGSNGAKSRSELDLQSGSLEGYSNKAWTSGGELRSSQQFSKANGDSLTVSSGGSMDKVSSKAGTVVTFGP